KKQKPNTDNAQTTGWRANFITSKQLAEGDFRPKWLEKRIFVEKMTAVVGASAKGMKTSLMIDLAVSLGSGTKFLGKFDVDRKVRVAMLSGESGRFTMQETAKRICAARGIDLADVDVVWGFELPQLGDMIDMARLEEALLKA